MRGNPKSLFLPSTFEERGTVAPFTTPTLALSRVRPDERHGLVLLMPNLGGADGAYVVPWAAVGDVITMSVHDRALHEEVLETRAVTPDAMRVAALKIARTGLAGPKTALAAEAALEAEEAQHVETHFLLILSLLGSLGMSSRTLLTLKPDSEEWEELVRGMLHKAGETLNVDANMVYDRIGALGRILTPIGLSVSRQEGRLRRLMTALSDFRASLHDWSLNDQSEMSPYAAFAAEVAELTVNVAAATFASLDKAVGDISAVISQWHKHVPLAERAANRLSWLLDGWDYILAMWDEVEPGNRIAQREGISQIMRVLPLIPRGETEWDENEVERRQELFQRRRIRAMMDWRTGQYDVELVTRYETIKAQAAELSRGVGGPRKVA
ncbi:MAG TPA: hypothetical protein VKQ29_06975 [Aliidongia sp.]|nr:hypothetical protein [Aliidongia sp.]